MASNNASVRELRAALKAQSDRLRANAASAIEAAAQELAAAIRARAPIRKGNLAKSVQAISLGAGKWRVQAGGDLTTKEVRKGSGKPYDYARATEFGTTDEEAHPFFYNTFRAKKGGIKSRVEKAARDALD